jgi:hypothetical protein
MDLHRALAGGGSKYLLLAAKESLWLEKHRKKTFIGRVPASGWE